LSTVQLSVRTHSKQQSQKQVQTVHLPATVVLELEMPGYSRRLTIDLNSDGEMVVGEIGWPPHDGVTP
jgi:hypothetical protein